MPGRYRTRRSYRNRRSYKKKSSTFSRFNTYRKRSSKAQAYQIYRLNKKINYVYKMNKPEIQIYQPSTATIDTSISTDTLGGKAFTLHRCIDQGLGIFDGKYARIKSIRFTGSFNWTGNVDNFVQEAIGCLRLIFFRAKSQIWGLPSVDDILPSNRSDFSNEYYMKCPLTNGFSTKYYLVGDYRFYLQPQKSGLRFINFNLKYPYSIRRSEDFDTVGHMNSAFPVNSLFCLSYIARCGEYVRLDTFQTELFMKLAFTDDAIGNASTQNKTVQPEDLDDDAKIITGISQEVNDDADKKLESN